MSTICTGFVRGALLRASACVLVVLASLSSIAWAQQSTDLAREAVTASPDASAGVAQAAQETAAEDVRTSVERRLERLDEELRSLLTAVEELRKGADSASSHDETAANGENGLASQGGMVLDSKWLQPLTWRSIGPAGMGGRISELAVVESDPSTYWIATASGGLLKTTNNGVTFIHQFDRENTVSIGSVCVAPSDPDIVWVGTGENNPRNSVSYGDGVYRSTDGGKTWKNMGLKGSFQIGRIVIHRTNPYIVYVGALGRLYGPNEERGVFKTIDGGETWERVLYIDDKTGVIDLQMHPTNPDTLLAATWERQRDGYDTHPGGGMPDGYDTYDPIKKWGPGSGIYKTTDAGKSWRKLTQGLPTNNMGRIGLDYYRKDPNIVFAIVDCEKIGMGTPPRSGAVIYVDFTGEETERGVRLTAVRDNGPSARAGLRGDDIVQAVAGKNILRPEQLVDEIRAHKIGDKVKLAVLRDEKVTEIELTLERQPERPGASAVYLGLSGEDAEEGVKVTRVAAEGPAEKAGIQAEDVVQAIGDKTVDSYRRLLEELAALKPGDKVKIKALRDGQSRNIEVTLGERPPGAGGSGAPARPAGAYAGILGEDTEQGVRLTNVVEDGPAAQAGLKRGDIIESAGSEPVERYAQLIEQIRSRQPGDKMELAVRREEERQQVQLTLGERPASAGGRSPTRPSGAMYGGQMENVQDQQGPNGHEYGGVYKSTDGGETWQRINSLNPRPMYFSQVRVDPSDEKYVYVLGIAMHRSNDGGKTFRPDGGRGIHVDHHALWINPRDGRHMVIGTDGGTYVTYDRADNWDHLNHMAIGQFYHVAIAPRHPYHVTGGLQDNGTWLGPALGLDGIGPINEDWVMVGGGDGFVCRVDPEDPFIVYAESQNGAIYRRNLRTGDRAAIRPARPDGAPPYRFNWNTPFILSSHNPRIFYSGGNHVFRSLDRGNNLQVISPEITLSKWGSATALAESPRNADVLYVGTDDGALWITRDGGRSWNEIGSNVGLPGRRWVATIEPSRFAEGRAYVVFDAHRSDDDEPYVYVTEDFGQTWTSIRSNLPWGSTRCLREDIRNPDLLYLGTEFGAWCSLDRGKFWNPLGSNLPTVAVHEIAIHPTNGEIVAATHGRSLWMLDVSALRQIKAKHLAADTALFEPVAVTRWRSEPARGRTNRRFVGQNPPRGAQIYYSLPEDVEKVTLRIVDVAGNTLRELSGKKEAGLHRLAWDLRAAPPRPAGDRGPRQASSTRPPAGPSARESATNTRRGAARMVPVQPGAYRLVLTVGDQELAQVLRVDPDPVVPQGLTAEEQEEQLQAEIEQRQADQLSEPVF